MPYLLIPENLISWIQKILWWADTKDSSQSIHDQRCSFIQIFLSRVPEPLMASHMQIHSTSSASLRQIKLLLDHMIFCGSIFCIYMLPDKHSVGTRFSNIDHDNSESNLFIKTNMKKLLTSQCRSPQNTKRLIQLSDPFQSLYFELFPLHYLSCSQLYCLQNSGEKKIQ